MVIEVPAGLIAGMILGPSQRVIADLGEVGPDTGAARWKASPS